MRKYLLSLEIIFLISGICFGAEITVSPSGTIGASIKKAMPGDTVIIPPGKYFERIKVENSGTASAPITIKSSGKGEVVWTAKDPEPKSWEGRFSIVIKKQEYLVFEGITFKDCSAWFYAEESNYITIKNCKFDGCKMYNGIQINSCGYFKFLDCDFIRATDLKEFSKPNKWVFYPEPGADYIEMFYASHHNLVENCRFGKINHVAVLIEPFRQNEKRPAFNIVRNNVFSDTLWKCMGIHNSDHTLVENNIFKGKTKNFIQFESHSVKLRKNLFIRQRDIADIGGFSENQFKGALLLKSGTNDKVICNVVDNRIYNNLFYDNEWTTGCYSSTKPVLNNIFKNNIFYKNKQTIFFPWTDYSNTNKNYVFNNLIMGVSQGEKLIKLASDSFSLSEAQNKLSHLYKDNFEADPKFVNADKDDFTLQKGSPCIDKGMSLTVTASEGKGKEVSVADPLYFVDGYGIIGGDEIIVGSNKAVKIAEVDYDKKLLKVDTDISWKKGDAVNLVYSGAKPDIGPFEFK